MSFLVCLRPANLIEFGVILVVARKKITVSLPVSLSNFWWLTGDKGIYVC